MGGLIHWGTNLYQKAIRISNIRHYLSPGFCLRCLLLYTPCFYGIFEGELDIRCGKSNFKTILLIYVQCSYKIS